MTIKDNSPTWRQILKNPAYHTIPGHLYTNTWPRRTESKIARLESTLEEWRMRDITLLNIGPGGVASKYAHMLPQVDEENIGLLQKNWKQLVNMRETRERNNPDSSLTCFETAEIWDSLSMRIGVRRTMVIDKYQKVIDGVNNLNIPNIQATCADIESIDSPAIGKYDVVVAYHVIDYCRSNQQAAYNFMFNAVKDGGFLAITLPDRQHLALPGFIMLKPNIYRKGERPDKKTGVKFKAEGLPADEIYRKSLEVAPIRQYNNDMSAKHL